MLQGRKKTSIHIQDVTLQMRVIIIYSNIYLAVQNMMNQGFV